MLGKDSTRKFLELSLPKQLKQPKTTQSIEKNHFLSWGSSMLFYICVLFWYQDSIRWWDTFQKRKKQVFPSWRILSPTLPSDNQQFHLSLKHVCIQTNTRKQKSNLPVFQDDFAVPSFLVVICCNVHVVAPPFKGTNLLSIQCVVPCIFLQFFVRTQVCCQHQGFAQLLGTKDAVFAILRMGSGNGDWSTWMGSS